MANKKNGLHHSPIWYEAHCKSALGSPMLRKMLKEDMAYIGADIDSQLTTKEKIHGYEHKWNECEANGEFADEREEVFLSENADELLPEKEYEEEPFTSIDSWMEKHGINEPKMRGFLKWRARRGANEKKDVKREQRIATEKPKEDPSNQWFEG